VVRLGPAAHRVRQVEALLLVVELEERAAVSRRQERVDRRAAQEQLVAPVRVAVDQFRLRPSPLPVGGLVRGDLGAERVGVVGVPEVVQVDPAEEAVPVGAVALAAPERLLRLEIFRDGAPDEGAHLDRLGPLERALGVFHEEVAPESAPEIAREPVLFLGLLELAEEFLEVGLHRGGERPLHHLVIGCGREVDPPGGGELLAVLPHRAHLDPAGVLLEEGEEALEIPLLVDPLVGARPHPELLPVVAQRDGAAGRAFRELAEVVDGGRRLVERDQIPEPLVDREDGEGAALVLREVVAAQPLAIKPGVDEVRVVEEGVVEARVAEEAREVRLPDPLREPHPARRGAEPFPKVVRHEPELPLRVVARDRREDRLIESAAEELDLPPRGELPENGEILGAVGLDPLEKRPGVVQGAADGGVALQHLQKRPVAGAPAVGEDVLEVAGGLVVVHRQQKMDLVHNLRAFRRWTLGRRDSPHASRGRSRRDRPAPPHTPCRAPSPPRRRRATAPSTARSRTPRRGP